jgi:hypothetical protein
MLGLGCVAMLALHIVVATSVAVAGVDAGKVVIEKATLAVGI